MPGKERLPEELWRRVDMPGSLRGRRLEEIAKSNTSSPRGSESTFKSQRE